ncbi:hypothetical protein AVEN_196208-1 [Araneus ventricosus]|uniref:Uncharacterized protein n=1 Tax=Araneus ventricosus TaxID=182803 RepID=A0A4Y2FM08_ARAVE|nr:hypothetical protein AVEN_196208-1 [Araneus ventricosus]
MKLDKTSSKAKTKIVKNARTKASEPCNKLKKNTRAAGGGLIPIRKSQDRKKVCRQIVSSKQNCPRTKAGKTKKLDEKKITKTGKTKKQDVKKIAKTGKTKDSKDKCTAYFSVELLEKDMRTIFRNFSDKIILNMPGKKQERIREIQCKIAGYETKKRKILKIVSQPGTKREEISRTANALQKMKEKRTEKPKEKSTKEKRRRSPAKLPSIERKQIKRKKPENPSTEDAIKNNSADSVSENVSFYHLTDNFESS